MNVLLINLILTIAAILFTAMFGVQHLEKVGRLSSILTVSSPLQSSRALLGCDAGPAVTFSSTGPRR